MDGGSAGLGVPAWGNALSAGLGRLVLRAFGWRLEVRLPHLPRFVVVAAPHTSNWDFVFGLAAVLALRIRVHWWGKHTLFRRPFGRLMRAVGGIPIDRSSSRGVVTQTVDAMTAVPQMVLAMAPEGTRKPVARWKSGFYQVAHAAQVPIVLAYIDYRRKVVGTGPVLHPSGDYAQDLAQIGAFYAGVTARHPAQFANVA